ncbi:MAG: hypothetical protein U9R56_05445, partial [candidate division Zixibacteria bacterium]|nr:hypothetical protein [candidate division Zixibacteria bacterium]
MVESVILAAENTISIELFDGKKNNQLTVYIVWPPSVDINADPEIIQTNGKSILTWSSINAGECSIMPYSIGYVYPAGARSVTPEETTTYTIRCSGHIDRGAIGGSATDSVTVTVTNSPIPSVSLSANPEIIPSGEVSTLAWTSINADTCVIDPDVGAVSLNGSVNVSPAETTTYTITATGPDISVTDSVTVTVTDSPIPTVSLSANPEEVQVGNSGTLTWASTDADSIVIEPDIYNGTDSNGSIAVWPTETTTYTITATGSGVSVTDGVTVTVVPAVTINANPLTVQPNGTCTLTWSVTGADNCVINPNIGSFGFQGSVQVVVSETTTYTLMAFGVDGISTATVTVTAQGNPFPTVSISANNEYICPTGKYSTLTWSSTDTDSCVIEPDIGVVNPSGSVLVLPTETTTYTITGENPEGSSSKNITVYICEPAPVRASISAEPYVIYKGSSTRLRWYSANVYTAGCVLTPGNWYSHGGPRSGTFRPTETTTYTVTAEGPGGTAVAKAKIIVIDPPSLTITAVPDEILPSQSCILTWDSPTTDTCVIEPGIGTVGSSGFIEIWPTESTTYTITVDGPLGPYSKTEYVKLIRPTISIEASPDTILPGETSILSWNASDADSCEITPDIGIVDVSGSIEVSPAESTQYRLTATNAGGNSYAYANVHVIEPPTAEIWTTEHSSTIQPGSTGSLSWRTTDADSCVIEPDIGSVVSSGTIQVSPSETTRYTITATGPLGTATDSCVIGVANSNEMTVFGPGQYIRTKGKANVYTETF